MNYLQTGDRQEQRGRAEDGPVGLKHKWTDWPHVTPGADLVSSAKKKATHKKAVGKASPKTTSTPTSKSSTTSSSGASKNGR